MNRCTQVRVLLAKAASQGPLDRGEERVLAEHLRRCQRCEREQRELVAMAAAVKEAGQVVPEATVDQGAQGRLKLRLRHEAAACVSPVGARRWPLLVNSARRAWKSQKTGHRRAWVLAAAAATLGVAVVVCVLGSHGGSGRWRLRSAVAAEIAGTVAGADSQAGADALVLAVPKEHYDENAYVALAQVEPAALERQLRRALPEAVVTRTDKRGRFVVRVPRPGTYVVSVFPPRSGGPQTATMTLGMGQRRSYVSFSLATPPTGLLPVKVSGPEGKPLPGTKVTLFLKSPGYSTVCTVTTDAAGRCQVRVPSGGVFAISATAEGYASADERSVTLTTEGENQELVFALGEAPPAGSLSGQVLLPDAKTPAAGVVVAPFATDRPFPGADCQFAIQGRSFQLRTRPPVIADEKGFFRVDGLPAGEYAVAACPQGFGLSPRTQAQADERRFLGAATSGEVQVGPARSAAQVKILLSRAGALSGKVTAAEGEQPVPGATVFAHGASPVHAGPVDLAKLLAVRHAATDKAGRFVLSGLAPGDYQVQISAPGYEMTGPSAAVSIQVEKITVVKLELQPTDTNPRKERR